jgi:hypothetical protein
MSGGLSSPTVGSYSTANTSAVGNILYPCLGASKALVPQGVTAAQ